MMHTDSEVFEWEASPEESQSLQQEDKKRRKRKGEKTNKILISAHVQAKISQKQHYWKERHAVMFQNNAFSSRSELIWLIPSLKSSKMIKKCILAKSS